MSVQERASRLAFAVLLSTALVLWAKTPWEDGNVADNAPVVAIDFDATLHLYRNGWTGYEPDEPPVEGALEFVRWLLANGYEPVVHTYRARTAHGKAATERWLAQHGFPVLPVVYEKPPAVLYVDDRGFRFAGDFKPVMDFLRAHPSGKSWVDDL